MKLTKYSQLEPGMRVRGKYLPRPSSAPKNFRGVLVSRGQDFAIKGDYAHGNTVFALKNENLGQWSSSLFADANRIIEMYTAEKKNLRDMEVGDVIVRESGGEALVLEVFVNGFIRSVSWDAGDSVGREKLSKSSMGYITFTEAESNGWVLKTSEEEDDTVEVTIEEIAKLKGVDVDKIRIKKEEE